MTWLEQYRPMVRRGVKLEECLGSMAGSQYSMERCHIREESK